MELVAQTASINCTFPEIFIDGGDYSCNATIIYGPNCQNRTNLIGKTIGENLISIGLRSFLEETRTLDSRYCGFVANVTANEKFLTVEGSLLGELFLRPVILRVELIIVYLQLLLHYLMIKATVLVVP